jgi:hypothetical protein
MREATGGVLEITMISARHEQIDFPPVTRMVQICSKDWCPMALRRNHKSNFTSVCFATALAAALSSGRSWAEEAHGGEPQQQGATDKGLRVFSCGHSFALVPNTLNVITKAAGITGHVVAGISSIGGSQAIEHFDVPDEKNLVKAALQEGSVDVLTLACMARPDEGIEKFATLAFEHNPNIRVTLQELWVPEDRWPFDHHHRREGFAIESFDAATGEDLRKTFQSYAELMDAKVNEINTKLGKQVLFVVPDGLAVIALRERIIAGTAPGLKRQSELFRDAWGHPKGLPLTLLSAYCHFPVIYRRSPVGLPPYPGVDPELSRLLQTIAWETVSRHPLSGVKERIAALEKITQTKAPQP